jgi:hypothetical protein
LAERLEAVACGGAHPFQRDEVSRTREHQVARFPERVQTERLVLRRQKSDRATVVDICADPGETALVIT